MSDSPTSVNTRIFRVQLGMILLIAFFLRLIAIASTQNLSDPDNYLVLAKSLVSGSGFSISDQATAYRPPLYPLVLAPLLAATGNQVKWGIAALHLTIGLGTVVLSVLTARRLWGSERRALVAGLIVACDPNLVWLSRSVMTEPLAAFLVAASLASLARIDQRGIATGGAWLGLAALCRPSLLAGGIGCCMFRLISGTEHPKVRFFQSATLLTIIFAVLTPWAVRNAKVFGEPIWTTTHGGYTLALANNPVYYREVLNGTAGVWTGQDQWNWWDSVNRATAGMPEPAADRYLKSQVLAFIQSRPWDFLRASIDRLGRFWSVAPAASVYSWKVRLMTALFTLPVWIGLLISLAQRRSWTWPTVAAVVQIASLSTVHSVYWTDTRMRAPVMPAIAVIVAGASLRRRSWVPASNYPSLKGLVADSKTRANETWKS